MAGTSICSLMHRLLDFEQTLRLEARIASLCDTKVDLLVKSPNDEELPIHRIAKKGV